MICWPSPKNSKGLVLGNNCINYHISLLFAKEWTVMICKKGGLCRL